MSTVTRVNFEPVRDVLPVQRAVFPLADPDLADPYNAVCLVDGEWMALNSSYQIARAATIANLNEEAIVVSWPLWGERGRTDVMSMGERRNVVLWLGMWEFDTRIYNSTVHVANGLAITAIGQQVKVQIIAIGSRYYCGLVGKGGGADAAAITVGFVTRLPADNGGKLRVRGGMLF